MQEESILTKLGLTQQDAQVYMALLKAGPTSIRQVAKATKINRGTTYEALKRLVNLGLVGSRTQGNRGHYFAEPPQKINDLIDEKQHEINQIKGQASELISTLKAFGDWNVGGPKVRFFEDDEGVVAILKDVLTTTAKLEPKDYCVYSSRALRQYIYRRFPGFTKRRVKEGIFVRTIAIGTGGDPLQTAERKWLPESKNESSSSYNLIYGDKFALISVSSDLTPYGVVIEDAGVAAMQRLLFNNLWHSL